MSPAFSPRGCLFVVVVVGMACTLQQGSQDYEMGMCSDSGGQFGYLPSDPSRWVLFGSLMRALGRHPGIHESHYYAYMHKCLVLVISYQLPNAEAGYCTEQGHPAPKRKDTSIHDTEHASVQSVFSALSFQNERG
ncbi:hypothetical protein BJ508DRAFT_308225 [Ascobolus immersus RN42]|uniref:Uncharacterized protein n=1 Tax=Ascobolus immersus RN42 TaxID=1160509 RepID=A0A3N4I0V6_ASCIM|nr:hypothetical protein BJ508DRAFT_308225 [Ascobolus immersus RN42]